LEAWGEFEALNALGNYAHENRDHTFPLFGEAGPRFEGSGLGHPLLQNELCVRNDVRLGESRRFYMISGSNMSGKSTLMRAIGLNAVLAFAGAPVRANSLQLSRFSLATSIAVTDSLLNGKSKFLEEVGRLRQTLEMAGRGPVLFLVDEIFSGTNSRDRRAAAEAVVRRLIARGAIGALSTHDMSLTEIAEAAGLAGENVHMGAREGGGPMDFDYLLKPGVTTETNALEIARMAGVVGETLEKGESQ
jgi:DNA mismatch repair ATPase MutS